MHGNARQALAKVAPTIAFAIASWSASTHAEPMLAPSPMRAIASLPFTYDSTGCLPLGGVLSARTSFDTSGAAMVTTEMGIGDVAEVGLSTIGNVTAGEAPFVLASFKLGVAESRTFEGQPAFALAFRKSFVHEHDGSSTRFAQLNLTASRTIRDRVAVHAGVAMWDSIVEGPTRTMPRVVGGTFEPGRVSQLVASAGVQVIVVDRVDVMLDAGLAHDRGELAPTVSLSGRYRATRSIAFESSYVTSGPITRLVVGLHAETSALRRAIMRLEPR
jgi:hypothetical protein